MMFEVWKPKIVEGGPDWQKMEDVVGQCPSLTQKKKKKKISITICACLRYCFGAASFGSTSFSQYNI